MQLSLFDLHCDTPYEMHRKQQPLTQNTLAVSLERARVLGQYVQVMAHWTDHTLDDETGWERFLAMRRHLDADTAIQDGTARIVTRYDGATPSSATLILALEDARILAGKLERVNALYDAGIRIVTPLWKGVTCIGGSHDVQGGLTSFGVSALCRALSLGMILDISHASERSAFEIFELSSERCRPVIASHSNAYAVCPVSRNLRDDQIGRILSSGGVIGLNLYGQFLRPDGKALASDVLPHVEHFLSLGAADALCLGCDMDGCDLPPDLSDLAALPHLAEEMLRHNYPESLVHKIFFENANRFAKKYFHF